MQDVWWPWRIGGSDLIETLSGRNRFCLKNLLEHSTFRYDVFFSIPKQS
ncbi:MAG: hypothetical protein BSOLF_0789 [Candidatus Carbobacillus altaicus]|uniref:Uncharacterized protein n=1 Tax=Candidatus Carbonibacillus altaicus TaxID=2163959 RepID=A0A2R6Y0F8_9BACL|nr:MAG: hypothetical protein BSOLF_0789 [Candidatus Carbobacillus altaicus]